MKFNSYRSYISIWEFQIETRPKVPNWDFDLTFGYCDIFISSNANTTNSYSRLEITYKYPHYDVGANEAKTFLAGSQTLS